MEFNSFTLSLYPSYQATLVFLGIRYFFIIWSNFIYIQKKKYRGFHHDQIQQIHDFKRENDNTSRTMYMKLARSTKEFVSVFMQSQLVKVFLSKINKRLIDLALSKIIIYYDDWTTFANWTTLDILLFYLILLVKIYFIQVISMFGLFIYLFIYCVFCDQYQIYL